MFKTNIIASCLLSIYSVTVFSAEPEEVRSTLQDQQDVAVTIYNDNLALIKDQRKVKLKTGLNNLAMRDVSAQIRPETALLRSLAMGSSLTILEQNFDFDLLTPQALLEKFVGRKVTVIKTNPANGQESNESAEVLAASNGVVLRMADRIETGIPGRISYSDVPANLKDRPTLSILLQNKIPSEQNVELSYLTSGLNWKADYVAELGQNEDKIDLSGWVTLNNTSGTSYRNAKLQLVAGDLNRVREPRPMAAKTMRMEMMADAAPSMQEESLLEYHLYSMDRPTTINENQSKQVALLSTTGINARKELVLKGADYYYQSSYGDLGQKMKVSVFLEFENNASNKLGIPLPKGVMRVYKKDTQGNAQFIGEDQIDHTPKNEKVRLKLGESFDVTADKKQTDFKKLPNPGKPNIMVESAYEIILKNAKKEPATVLVQEPIPGDWKILKASHVADKSSSNTATWKIEVPAEGKTTLNYRVQVKY